MSDDSTDEKFPFELLEDPAELAAYSGWREEVYRDFLALQNGRMDEAEFERRYHSTHAILVLDITGFSSAARDLGALTSFLRIFDVQKVCIPVLKKHGAEYIRAFADDLVAIYPDANAALDAALEMHRRMAHWRRLKPTENPAEVCVGIGYGAFYTIGPNRAMGAEMNHASKLGEDVARGGETLLTEGAREALAHRRDVRFEVQRSDDFEIPYFRVVPAAS